MIGEASVDPPSAQGVFPKYLAVDHQYYLLSILRLECARLRFISEVYFNVSSLKHLRITNDHRAILSLRQDK